MGDKKRERNTERWNGIYAKCIARATEESVIRGTWSRGRRSEVVQAQSQKEERRAQEVKGVRGTGYGVRGERGRNREGGDDSALYH